MDELSLLSDILKNNGQFKTVYIKTNNGKVLSKYEPKTDYTIICMNRADLDETIYETLKLNFIMIINQPLNLLEKELNKLEFENENSKIFDAVIDAEGIHFVVENHAIT